LNKKNAAAFRKKLAPLIEHARWTGWATALCRAFGDGP